MPRTFGVGALKVSHNPAIGRFLSVDPLTRSYPWYTPYQFAGNKPIWAVDLDGLEEYIASIRRSSDDELKVKITRSETIKIVNYSSTEIFPGVAESIAPKGRISRFDGSALVPFVFAKDLETGERTVGERYDAIIDVSHKRRYVYTDNLQTIQKNEGILLIVDDIGTVPEKEKGPTAGVGLSGTEEGYNRVFIVEAKQFLSKGGAHTIAHEEGHRLGLEHLHEKPNVMSYDHPTGSVLPEQKQAIGENLFTRLMNFVATRSGYDFDNFIVRFNYGKSANADIEEALDVIDDYGGSYTKPE